MQDWTENLRKPFNKQKDALEKKLRVLEDAIQEVEAAVKPWPEQRKKLENIVFPTFSEWNSALEKETQAFISPHFYSQKKLDRGIQRLERIQWITWWHPLIWSTRIKIGMLKIWAGIEFIINSSIRLVWAIISFQLLRKLTKAAVKSIMAAARRLMK